MQPVTATNSYHSKILRLALPNILSNISVPLLGAVDTAIIGRLDGLYYLGAIAVGSLVFDFIFWGFGFLRMGTTGLVAQAFGASDDQGIQDLLVRVLVVGLGTGCALILLKTPIAYGALALVSPSEAVYALAFEYIQIRIWAAPATLVLYGLNGWFLGMQNARYPMIVTIILNLSNLVLNIYFVLILEWNVAGVALGSVIASYLGFMVAFVLFISTYSSTWSSDWWLVWRKKHFWALDHWVDWLSVNRDIFIRTLCLIGAYAYFTTVSARSGDLILATNTVLLQLWYISSYGIDGFAYAAESLSGKYWGARDRSAFQAIVRSTMQWGLGLGGLFSVVYAAFHEELIELFTTNQQLIIQAKQVIVYTILAPLVNSVCFIWDGIYMGTSTTKPLRNTMLLATFVVFVPLHVMLEPLFAMHSIWISMLAFMVFRGVLLSLLAPKKLWSKLPS
jgi:MATE family multidrug resistance protein